MSVEIFTVYSPSLLMLPTRPLSTFLFVMLTLDNLYSHHNLSFAIRTAKAAANVKQHMFTNPTSSGIPHSNLIRSILRRFAISECKIGLMKLAVNYAD